MSFAPFRSVSDPFAPRRLDPIKEMQILEIIAMEAWLDMRKCTPWPEMSQQVFNVGDPQCPSIDLEALGYPTLGFTPPSKELVTLMNRLQVAFQNGALQMSESTSGTTLEVVCLHCDREVAIREIQDGLRASANLNRMKQLQADINAVYAKPTNE